MISRAVRESPRTLSIQRGWGAPPRLRRSGGHGAAQTPAGRQDRLGRAARGRAAPARRQAAYGPLSPEGERGSEGPLLPREV